MWQEDEDFEGIELDTPLGSFRAGRGRGTALAQEEDYYAARRRVRRKMAFFRHLTTYISVLLLLVALDLVTGGRFWVHWVAVIWGIILTIHFLNVWVFDALLGREAEKRMIESELRKRNRGGQ
jgi:hypothetical protein